MFLAIWFSFSSTVRTGLEVHLMVRLNDPYASLPTGEILWLCNGGLVKNAPERERYEKSNILKGKIIFFYHFYKAMYAVVHLIKMFCNIPVIDRNSLAFCLKALCNIQLKRNCPQNVLSHICMLVSRSWQLSATNTVQHVGQST